jgi:hypothetical protein
MGISGGGKSSLLDPAGLFGDPIPSKTDMKTTTSPKVPSQFSGPTFDLLSQIGDLAKQPVQITPASQLQQKAFGMAGDMQKDALAGSDLSRYENPFQRDVIDSTIADWGHGVDVGAAGISAAMPNGAYGGSRMGVTLGQYGADNARTLAATLAGLNKGNFDQAQDAAKFDINNNNTQLGQIGALGEQQHKVDLESNPQAAQMQQISDLLAMIQQANPGLYTTQTQKSKGEGTAPVDGTAGAAAAGSLALSAAEIF